MCRRFFSSSATAVAVAVALIGLFAAPKQAAAQTQGEVQVPVNIDTTKMKLPRAGAVVLWVDRDTGYKVVGQVVNGRVTNVELYAPNSGKAVPHDQGSDSHTAFGKEFCILKKCWTIHFLWFKKKICFTGICLKL